MDRGSSLLRSPSAFEVQSHTGGEDGTVFIALLFSM